MQDNGPKNLRRRSFLKAAVLIVFAPLTGCGGLLNVRKEEHDSLIEAGVINFISQMIWSPEDNQIDPVMAAFTADVLAQKDDSFKHALEIALLRQKVMLEDVKKVALSSDEVALWDRSLAQKALAARSTDDLRRVLAPLTGTTAQRRQFIDAMNLTPDEALGRIQGGCPSGRFILTTGENGEGTMRCAPVPAAAPR